MTVANENGLNGSTEQQQNEEVLMPPAWAVPSFVKSFEATRFKQVRKLKKNLP